MMIKKGMVFVFGAVTAIAVLRAEGQSQIATGAHFQIVKQHNPKAIVDLATGLWPHPMPVDYDEDGKIDLLVSSAGTPSNGLFFFKNLSGGKTPLFDKPVRLSKGWKNIEISYANDKPAFMIPGILLQNFTTSFGKEKQVLFPVDSILKDIGEVRANQWKLVDYDGDGDADIVAGIGDWGDYGWDNAFDKKGHWTHGPLHGYVYLMEYKDGQYINRGKIKTTDHAPIDVFGAPSPNFADFDGDGDLDLICGSFLDELSWFENVGSRKKPRYAPAQKLSNHLGVIHMPLEMLNVTAIDWDKDGDEDLLIGQEDGRVAWLENTAVLNNHMPVFKSPVFFKQKADNLKFGVLSTPYAVDWDGDGKTDIISGNSAGHIAFIKNLGGTPPRWAVPVLLKANGKPIRIMAGENGSIQGPAEAKWGYTTLSVADWDGDGQKDLIINSIWGQVMWFRNTGTRTAPELAAAQPVTVEWNSPTPPKPSWNWWTPAKNTLVTQWRTTPYAIDWNKDGLMDLISLDAEGYLCVFERRKKNGKPILTAGQRLFYGTPFSRYNSRNTVTDSIPGPLQLNSSASGGSGRRKFCMGDWDGDGRMDLLVNSLNISLMRNTGNKGDTVRMTDQGPLTTDKLAGHTTSPTLFDWNNDGVPDLLVGAEDGHFYYLINNRPTHNKAAKPPAATPLKR